MKTKLITEAIKLYKKTLDVNSKWYNEDLKSFTIGVNTSTVEQLQKTVNNLSYLQSKQSDVDFEIETKKLDKAGMFNIGNLKPINALD